MSTEATALERLKEVLHHSTGGMRIDWGGVKSTYGIDFPSDYMDFLSMYGSGEVDGMLAVFAPNSDADPFERRTARLPEDVRDLPEVNEWSDDRYAELYTPADILVWGETVEADVLGWVTVGPAEEWPVASYTHGGSWTLYDCSMTEFLLRLLTGRFEENPTGLTRLFGAGSAQFTRD